MKFLEKHSVFVSQTMKFVLQKSSMRKSYRESTPSESSKQSTQLVDMGMLGYTSSGGIGSGDYAKPVRVIYSLD